MDKNKLTELYKIMVPKGSVIHYAYRLLSKPLTLKLLCGRELPAEDADTYFTGYDHRETRSCKVCLDQRFRYWK